MSDPGKARRRREITWFIVIAYGISFVFWIPVMLATLGIIDGLDPVTKGWFGKIIRFDFASMTQTEIMISLGGLGPITSATVLSYRYGGMLAVRNLFARVVQVRFSPLWYLAAFSLFFIAIIGAWLEYLFTGQWGFRGDSFLEMLPTFAMYVVAITIFIVLEEPGWRGFMLPRLQADYSALWSSVLAGLAWSYWHLPYFFALGYLADGVWGGVMLAVSAPVVRIPVSIIITWAMNSVGGSIFICMLIHAVKNSSNTMVDLESAWTLSLIHLMAIALVVILGKEKLSRRAKFIIR